uniref:Bm2011, isoform b n=2 Tax=Brugia malayi TaxID=6279 RepID=A0A0J9Y759_BRUMA|nr:Bm2011, isoform b [Brugia malayi]
MEGNETLRAHMYKQHQISRMFMCRCCNWAFPDKTSLHMHMQAKEEGKTISVPVIGKGNPPTTHQHQQEQQQQQQQNENLTGQTGLTEKGRRSPQLSTLHVPQPRVPATNPFAPLQLHSLVGLAPQQAVSLTEQSSLQAAAATLFSPMALLRDTSGSGTHVDDLMSKLRERLMLNNLVAQSSFGLAAWLSAYPKMDQSNANGGNPLDMCSSKDSDVNLAAEEDEINVDKEYDDDMITDRNSTEQHQSHIMELNGKTKVETSMNLEENNNNNTNSNIERPKSANVVADDKKILHESLLRPASNAAIGNVSSKTMPNLRSAINSSPKNGNLILKNNECKVLLNGVSNSSIESIITNNNNNNTNKGKHTISESSDPIESHISPSETHSSTSNGTSPPASRECYECAIYRGKLAMAENRCRYLEGKTATLQSDAIRFSTRVTASENSARQYEQEGRFLREQNEILQRKILECQEKTLAFMQADQATNAQAVALYLNDILKTTFLR